MMATNPDPLQIGLDALLFGGLLIGGMWAYGKFTSNGGGSLLPGTPDLSGGQQGALIGVPAVTGTPGKVCSGYPAPGSQIGNQVFLAGGSTPQCGTLTSLGGSFLGGGAAGQNAPYQQNGYVDPTTGQFVHQELTFIVYRCINVVTGGDDGRYYLAPVC